MFMCIPMLYYMYVLLSCSITLHIRYHSYMWVNCTLLQESLLPLNIAWPLQEGMSLQEKDSLAMQTINTDSE